MLLPTAEVARFRRTMNAAADREREEVQALAETVWAAVKTTPVTRRQAAAEQWIRDKHNQPVQYGVIDRAWWERADVVASMFAKSKGKKPGESEVASAGFARASSRTRWWGCGEASVVLVGREAVWSVPENNRAVEHARGSWLGVTLFGFLGSVRWTRGSGSEGFVGNNEYNRESVADGGGGNFVTERFGPLGEVALGRLLAGPWV